jgi:hypothetical protein
MRSSLPQIMRNSWRKRADTEELRIAKCQLPNEKVKSAIEIGNRESLLEAQLGSSRALTIELTSTNI